MHLREGIAAAQANRLDEAARHFESMLAREPDHVDALNNLAVVRCGQRRLADAEAIYRRLLARLPDAPHVRNNLAVVLRDLGQKDEPVPLLTRAVELAPDYADAWRNLGFALIDLERHDEAARALFEAARLQPQTAEIEANLARALHASGRTPEALEHGRTALEIKDRHACLAFSGSGGKPLAARTPPAFNLATPARNIIAFSLWGTARCYTQGALENAALAHRIYPGWTCRFYVDSSVTAEVVAELRRLEAQVVEMPEQRGPNYGLFWRFLAADDPAVDRFLCRDCDARLNAREAAAVQAWLASPFAFHAMRDAPFHTELLLAGLWGGVGGALSGIGAAIDRFYRPGQHRWVDQDFLRLVIWPRIRPQLLTHDGWYDGLGALPFPEGTRLEWPDHVGAGRV
jgi:tetratricopeptide (TPR) repeat protein